MTFTHFFVQAVCVLCAVCQTLRESVAAGVTQGCMFTALQTSLSQQNGPDLTNRLTPLLLPAQTQTLWRAVTKRMRRLPQWPHTSWFCGWTSQWVFQGLAHIQPQCHLDVVETQRGLTAAAASPPPERLKSWSGRSVEPAGLVHTEKRQMQMDKTGENGNRRAS